MWVIFAMVVALALAAPVRAASPDLANVIPRGGQRGTEINVVFHGDRLGDAREVFVYSPGVTFSQLDAKDPKKLTAKVTIAPDAPLGEHCLRVRTATGITPLRTFYVGALPHVDEKEPNSEFDKSQKIELNVTVNGVITNEDLDYYAIDLKKGQRITAEVEGMRLASTAPQAIFDPFVAILDGKQFELIASDDSALFLQDPVLSLAVPEDGRYYVFVRESAYGGDDNSHYRLHVGAFPRPRAVFPPGGQAGTEQAVKFIGDIAGEHEQTFKLPAEFHQPYFPLFLARHGAVAPSANRFRISPFGNVMEAEPNNEIKTATPVAALPIAMNGVIGDKGDVDFFKVAAKKDQTFDFNVYARRLRSPLDSVIHIFDAAGKVLNGNDDNQSPDSYQRFTFPADGEYTIRIYDQLYDGGPDYVYRIEVSPITPAATLGIPLITANSQERQTIVVPRGNRYATLIRATRSDFAGDIKLSIDNLPQGITMHADTLKGDMIPVLFEADDAAATGGALVDVVGTPTEANSPVRASFSQTVDLVYRNNQPPYYTATVSKLAVAVAEEVPFKLNIVQPKVPIVQNGSMQLKVIAERKPGFAAPINLTMLQNPPGIGSGGVAIAENTSEATMTLSASGDAAAGKSKICVIGNADINGTTWAASPFAELEVAAPFVTAKVEMAAAEQGKSAPVLINLEQKTPFDGKAKVQLVGLPPNATAPEMEITSADKTVVFEVKADAKTPVGQHNALFCIVTVTKDGEPIVHNIGQGGVLRVDAPAPSPATAQVVAAPTTAPVNPEKPLSRLDKLRLEAKQAMKQ
ncbi:MAG TPA: PPC domain-containing protein [Tepidisphaeraceae bacterium]|nr:PPC domain-containing protein [Tepidisphaeraceae bacterium]